MSDGDCRPGPVGGGSGSLGFAPSPSGSGAAESFVRAPSHRPSSGSRLPTLPMVIAAAGRRQRSRIPAARTGGVGRRGFQYFVAATCDSNAQVAGNRASTGRGGESVPHEATGVRWGRRRPPRGVFVPRGEIHTASQSAALLVPRAAFRPPRRADPRPRRPVPHETPLVWWGRRRPPRGADSPMRSRLLPQRTPIPAPNADSPTGRRTAGLLTQPIGCVYGVNIR